MINSWLQARSQPIWFLRACRGPLPSGRRLIGPDAGQEAGDPQDEFAVGIDAIGYTRSCLRGFLA